MGKNNESPKLNKSGKFYRPMKEDGGNERETPPAGDDGHVIGTPGVSKGFDHTKVTKHEGIVIGGSVTKGKKSVSEKAINKTSSGGKRNILGSG